MIGTIDELIDYYEALEDQETKNREHQAQNNRQSTFRRDNNRRNATKSNEKKEETSNLMSYLFTRCE
jgi:Asp-tRNA(Asn)/Glu-tRNA(Gln) amidotransferase C subunit